MKNNKSNSLGRLSCLVKILTHRDQLERYDNIIQDQIKEGIVEKVDEVCEQEITEDEKVFYLLHKPIIRKSVETSKLRIVYDASSKPTKNSVSLNDCLETGPLLQNSMWNILVRSRFKPILLCGDIEKTFLQIRIRGCERNVLRFRWVYGCDPNRVEINKFTRLVFGLTQSPFILETTLKVHFLNYLSNYPEVIENILVDMYVYDLTSGGNTVGEVEILKQKYEELFKNGSFNLHKWHSDIPYLEDAKTTTVSELTYAEQMFQTSSNETKTLGLLCNKLTDKLSISIPNFQQTVTKRNALSYVASIYDPLGIISPCHVLGKVIYSELCDEKIPWDAEAPEHLKTSL